MNAQIGGAVALAIMGFFFIVIAATARDEISNGSFGDKLSKAGLLVGSLFILPLIFIVILGIIVGFPS